MPPLLGQIEGLINKAPQYVVQVAQRATLGEALIATGFGYDSARRAEQGATVAAMASDSAMGRIRLSNMTERLLGEGISKRSDTG